MKTLTAIFLILTTAFLAQARLMRTWSYQELYDQADLVIIAKPVSTKETAEKATLPNIAPDVHVVGLSTEFEISLVVKGDKSVKKATLHHYRLADPKQLMMNGPSLASFDPKQHTRFLLFLRRETDGRYSPVSGQTDPTLFSVLKLEGLAG
jgi:hypothetical protein